MYRTLICWNVWNITFLRLTMRAKSSALTSLHLLTDISEFFWLSIQPQRKGHFVYFLAALVLLRSTLLSHRRTPMAIRLWRTWNFKLNNTLGQIEAELSLPYSLVELWCVMLSNDGDHVWKGLQCWNETFETLALLTSMPNLPVTSYWNHESFNTYYGEDSERDGGYKQGEPHRLRFLWILKAEAGLL